jgi:glucose-6-phosphate dehydrogenase assembly protein OpcA
MVLAVANIEKELQRLFDEQKKKKQIKACLFNLIIYTHETRRTKYFQHTVNAIIEKFPCRILFIEADKEKSPKTLEVQVTSETTGSIACDQIAITVSPDMLSKVSYLVIPHLVPDLPIYLLWGQDPTAENELFPALQKFATRLIFDSECTADLQHFALEMLKHMSSFKLEFMDMHWALLSGWREAMAQTFDTPDRLDALKNARSIQITYNAKKTPYYTHTETQSIYLQGWLASALDWNFVSKDGGQVNYDKTTISLQPQEHPSLTSGTILGVDVIANDDLSFSMRVNEPGNKIIVHITHKDLCEMPFTLPLKNLERGLTFMQEIFFSSAGRHYRSMLEMIANTPW